MKNPIFFFKSRIISFKNAFSGLFYVIRTQKNAWIHAISTIAVLGLSLWLKLSFVKISILILAITSVWAAEFINTALEAVVDLSSPSIHPLAKVGKDVGAASVLIAALSSIIIGILIIGPSLYEKLINIYNVLR